MEREEASKVAKEISEYVKPAPSHLKSHWPKKGQLSPNTVHQADLLFMPVDEKDGNGFRYILVVVDVGTRLIAARPLAKKGTEIVAAALKDIYENSELKWPVVLQVDSGSEFRSDVSTIMKEHGSKIRRSQPNRHTQQAIVEGNNRVIAKHLFHEMLTDEVKTNQKSTAWVSNLPKFVDIINANRKKVKNTKPVENIPFDPNGKDIELIPHGTIVRYALDSPVDYVTKKKTDSKFRVGDVRWSEPVKISQMLLMPGSPPRYMVEGKKDVSYSRNQIKVIN